MPKTSFYLTIYLLGRICLHPVKAVEVVHLASSPWWQFSNTTHVALRQHCLPLTHGEDADGLHGILVVQLLRSRLSVAFVRHKHSTDIS